MTTPRPSLDAARAAFEAEQLPWPPLLARFEARLRHLYDFIWATRQLPASAYVVEHYVQEIIEHPTTTDYAVVGFDGHGINSWAAHFFLVTPSLALFIQTPWGGAYTDAPASREELRRLFDWAGTLQPRLALREQRRGSGTRERLLVVASRFISPGWAWLAPDAAFDSIDWQPAEQMLSAIDRSIDRRLADDERKA